MKSGPIPETLLEAAALATNLVPRPVFDTLVATGLARTLMVASRLGVFDALADGPLDAAAVAQRCDTEPHATDKLLGALAGSSYLQVKKGRYSLAPVARRWLLSDGRGSLHDHMDLMFVTWRWLEHYETYVRTGEPLDVHADLSPQEWGSYQRGMRALASLLAPEVALRTPVPRRARDMLDIGGSHGFYSVALCRRHRKLQSTVLDLPEAVAHAGDILAREAMGARVTLQSGDARTADLGEARYDLIYIANLLHHFDDGTNAALLERVARALRPGGVVVVQEIVRHRPGMVGEQPGALGDLYFAALSAAGIYSFDEIAQWQRAAGLKVRRPRQFLTYPGVGQQAATKAR